MRRNKGLIIIISVVLAIVIVGAIFAYMFLMTDALKGNRELFAKYFTQSLQSVNKVIDFETVKIYENLKTENKYESATNVKLVHSEGGEVSDSMNNISAKLDIQKNDEEQYSYIYGQILYDNETYLQAEIIKEDDTYGLRLAEAAKQFIAVSKDENFEAVANDIGTEVSQLDKAINVINGDGKLGISKEKYMNILTTAISNGVFEKQKDAMITYNNITTKTNAYAVTIGNQQVKSMLLEILNNIKSETEILDMLQIAGYKERVLNFVDGKIAKINNEIQVPDVKIIVYQNKQKTIRTEIQIGLDKIIIENIEQNGEIKTNIQYSKISGEETQEYVFDIIKRNIENQENFDINLNATVGEESYTITLDSQIQKLNNEIQFNGEVSHQKGIVTKSLKLENKVTIGNDFEKSQSLSQGSKILLNAGKEEKRKGLIELYQNLVQENIYPRADMIKEKLGLKSVESENQEEELPQVEINKFNAKFEFYTGDQVSAENVKTLLDIVKNNLGSYEIIENQEQENVESVIPQVQKTNIKLNIQKDKAYEEGINKVLEKIDDNKKYKILISYKDTNGLIDYITITEI